MEALRRRFVERAQDEERALIAAWNEAGRPAPTPIERTIHNMAGLAGTLSFDAIHHAAARIDDRFAAGETPDEGEVSTLLKAIDDL